MNELQNDRVAQAVRKLFRIQQSNSPLPTLAIELQAGWDLAEDDRPVTALALGWEYAQGASNPAAPAAGEVGIVGVRNPLASGKIAVVELVQFCGAVAAGERFVTWLIAPEAAFPFVITFSNQRDGRRAIGTGNPPVFVGSTVNVGAIALGADVGFLKLAPAGDPLPLNVVLIPGQSLYMFTNVLAQQLGLAFWYRYRNAEPGELAI